MSVTASPSLRWRVRRVVVELDADGRIDGHAAMCLQQAIEAARGGPIEMILVDLRDLTAITPAGLALFATHSRDCRAHGNDLGLLICANEHDDPIAEAFVLAGIGDILRYTDEPGLRAEGRAMRVLDDVRSVRCGRLGRTARRVSRCRRRRAGIA